MNCLSNMLWYISVRTCNNEGECHDRIEHLFDTIGRFAPYEYSGRMKTMDFKIPFVHPLTKLVDVQACFANRTGVPREPIVVCVRARVCVLHVCVCVCLRVCCVVTAERSPLCSCAVGVTRRAGSRSCHLWSMLAFRLDSSPLHAKAFEIRMDVRFALKPV